MRPAAALGIALAAGYAMACAATGPVSAVGIVLGVMSMATVWGLTRSARAGSTTGTSSQTTGTGDGTQTTGSSTDAGATGSTTNQGTSTGASSSGGGDETSTLTTSTTSTAATTSTSAATTGPHSTGDTLDTDFGPCLTIANAESCECNVEGGKKSSLVVMLPLLALARRRSRKHMIEQFAEQDILPPDVVQRLRNRCDPD